MLQQTQVSRVLEKYPRFIARYPTFAKLARATTADVVRAWSGMGYNNRAVRLRALARTVTSRWRGQLPEDPGEMQKLPGVGRYTSHAVACFAFEQTVPLVDTNIRRVLSRLFPAHVDPWQTAAALLPRRDAYQWNQALMELGALVCTSGRPRCDACPLRTLCPSAYRITARRTGARRIEPGRDGLPNRIYRGRIVELLRSSGVREIGTVGKRVKPGFSSRDRRWLLGLLAGLERDGLIRTGRQGRRQTVRLAS